MNANPLVFRAARRAVPLLLATLALAPAAQAALDPKYDPHHVVIPALHPFKTYKPERFVLGNGMVVFLQEDHRLPIISGTLYCRASSGWEPGDKAGLGAMTGSVMRSGGTATHSGDWLDDRLGAIGASISTSLNLDLGYAGFRCLQENAAEVIGLMADVVRNPAYPDDKIELAKVNARRNIAQRNDNLTSVLSRVATQAVFGKDSPQGRTPEYATIDAITRADLVKLHDLAFTPDRSYVVIFGDFRSAEMRKLITDRFATWKKNGLAAPAMPPTPEPGSARLLFAPKDDVTQSGILLGHVGFLAKDPDYPAMDVYENLLGGGFQSRLLNKIRTERGLAYAAGASSGSGYARPGVFQAYSLTRSESTMVAFDLLRSEVDRSLTEPLGDEEVKRAQETALNSLVFANSSPSSVAFRAAYYEMFGYPPDFLQQYQKAVAATTPAAVQAAARRKVHPDHFVAVIVGKEKDFDRPLASAGLPVERVDIAIPPPASKTAAVAATPASLEQGAKWLARAVELAGGRQAWAAVQSWQSEGQFSLSAQGQTIAFTQSISWQLPDRRLTVQKLPFGEMSSGFDGKVGWRSGMGQIEEDPKAAQSAADEYAQSLFRLFADSGKLRVQALEEPKELDGVRYAVALVRSDDVHDWTLYFAPDGRLARMSFASSGPKGPAVEAQAYEDWKPVGSIRYPHSLTVYLDGEKFVEGKLTSAQVNPKIDPAVFAKPAK